MKTSVLISNYNYANYLPRAIESVLESSVSAHEIIIVDDGSTDHSREVLERYGPQITPIFQPNSGQAAAISNGFAHSTGDVICLLDADDLFHPHKIEILQQVYESHPDINWIFHDLKEVYAERLGLDDLAISQEIAPRLIDQKQNMIEGTLGYDSPATSGLTFRRGFMEDFFPMPRAQGITLSDHYIKFYCLAVSTGFHIKEPLGIQVLHDKNLYTGKQSSKALATRARIFANTAIYLEKIAPHTETFCQNLMSEAMRCALRAGIFREFSDMTSDYLTRQPFGTRIKIKGKAFLKHVAGRS